MGNVLRALKKSGRVDSPTIKPAVHVVSLAVASAERVAREALDSAAEADRDVAAVQPSETEPAPAPTETAAAETIVRLESPPAAAQPAEMRFHPLLVLHHRPRCLASEQTRQLRESLLGQTRNEPVRCMITSAQPREGKTVTAANLAYCFSEIQDKRTLLIDGDLRSGKLSSLFDLCGQTGLADLLAGKATIFQAIHRTPRENLDVVPAGTCDLDGIGRLLSGEQGELAVKQLMRGYDCVIIDSPPAQDIADAGIIGRWSTSALMIVRMRQTARQAVDEACRVLRSAGVNLVGLVSLDSQAGKERRYGYYTYR